MAQVPGPTHWKATDPETIRVLLVDDDEDQYVLTRSLLAGPGNVRFKLEWVASFAEGRRQILERRHDVYLLDYHLDAGNGLELLDETTGGGYCIPAILLTGQGDPGMDILALQLGAADYLDKASLTPQVLQRSIRYSLAQARNERAMRENVAVLGLVNALNLAANRGDEMEEILDLVTGEAARAFGGTGATCYLLSPDRSFLESKTTLLPGPLRDRLEEMIGLPQIPRGRIPLRPGSFFVEAMETGWPQIVDDVDRLLRVAADTASRPENESFAQQILEYLPRQHLIIGPIGGGQDVFGLLSIARDFPFEAHDLSRVQMIGDQLAAILIQRKAREALEQSKRTKRALLDVSEDFVALLDREYRFVIVNATMALARDMTPEQLVGARVADHLPPEVAEARRVWFDQVIETGMPVVFDDEVAGRNFLTRMAPVFDESGRVIQVAVFARDVTPVKEAEALRDRLRKQVAESQKMEAIGRLSGGIAHDFNNLLTIINGFAELMIVRGSLGEDGLQMATNILRAGQRASQLVQQLLAFGQRQATFPSPLDLNRLLGQIEGSLRAAAGSQVRVGIVLGPDLWPVVADHNQIAQLCRNLAANARDSMPNGGSLIFETSNARLSPEQVVDQLETTPGDYVLLRVLDTGSGFDEQALAHMFEPFYFSGPEVADERGLRLAAAFGIIKQNHGHIRVDSKEGQGTVFRIYLPRHQE